MRITKKDVVIVVEVCIIICLALWIFGLYTKSNGLENEVAYLQESINSMDDVNEKNTANIKEYIRRQQSLLSKSNVYIQSFNKEHRTVNVVFSMTPKKRAEELEVFVAYRPNGIKETVVPTVKRGHTYIANVTIPLSNFIEYRVIFDDGKERTIEEMPDVNNISENFALDLKVDSQNWHYNVEEDGVYYSTTGAIRLRSVPNDNRLKSAHIEVLKNDQVVLKKKIHVMNDPGDVYKRYPFKIDNTRLDVKQGDSVFILFRAEDTSGIGYYYLSDKWKLDEKGNVQTLQYAVPRQWVIE